MTYRRKSFSIREDDSCGPHSQFNQENNFERCFIFFFPKRKKKKEVQDMFRSEKMGTLLNFGGYVPIRRAPLLFFGVWSLKMGTFTGLEFSDAL